jgi:chorismate mutase
MPAAPIPPAQVIERVQRKAATFGQDLDALGSPSSGSGSNGGSASGSQPSYKIKPEAVAELYEQWVMPLTKEVEVQYLLQRLDD